MLDWLYTLFGWIMQGIDWAVFHVFGIHNIGLCIILFTIIIYTLMIPLNTKQQKSSRLMSKINPEIQDIQAKYKGKKDNESAMKMNAETQAVYAKYGVSPFGGCLPLLISMPILLVLYAVIREIDKYVPSLAQEGANMFLGLDVSQTPSEYAKVTKFAYLVPALAVVFQFINTKMLQMKTDNKNKQEDSMASSMKMMNYFMPFMSGFFCLTLNIGIGIYWIISSIYRIIQAYFINRHVDKISLDELIEMNKDKALKKNKKLEERNKQMEMYSKQRTSSIKTASSYQNRSSASNQNSKNQDFSRNLEVNKDIEPGSIAGYAHMLSGKKNGKDKY